MHRSTRVGGFEVENLSRVPGDACRYARWVRGVGDLSSSVLQMERVSRRTDHGELFVADTSTRNVGDRNDAIIPLRQTHCAVEDRGRICFGQTLDAANCRLGKTISDDDFAYSSVGASHR